MTEPTPNAEYFEANRRNWDDRASIHAESSTYDLERFVDEPERLSGVVDFDRRYLGDLAGQRVVHLQCHIGTDTLSIARLGAAEVTGLDQSAESLAVARQLFAATGTSGRFVESNVYDAVRALGETFDLVYTGVGAINWLPDIDGWAKVVSELLDPGGRLYIREGHPMMYVFDDERADDQLVGRFPYFETSDPMTFDFDESYVESERRITETRSYEWNHGLSEVFTALTRHGLTVTEFVEHRVLEWKMFDHMVEAGDGRWQLPDDQRDLCPLMFSMTAVKGG